MHYTRPEKHYVKPGDVVVAKGCWSEMMWSMGLADKYMPVEILENGYGQLRDPKTGRNFSMPSPLGWISAFYEDKEKGWYGTEVYEIGVGHTVTHSPGKFYVYADGYQLYGVCSHRFEEMRDAAREMHTRDIPSAEVRFVENSHRLPVWWSRSVVIPLDVEIQEYMANGYRKTWLDLPTHANLFAGRYEIQEVQA